MFEFYLSRNVLAKIFVKTLAKIEQMFYNACKLIFGNIDFCPSRPVDACVYIFLISTKMLGGDVKCLKWNYVARIVISWWAKQMLVKNP